MKLIANYLQRHSADEPVNWRENYIGDSLFYSYRCTEYDADSYPSSLHYHDYYELVAVSEGDISYVCEADVYAPSRGDIILIPPRCVHMSRLSGERTVYGRHVFYLYPDAFESIGCGELAEFLRATRGLTVIKTDDSDGLLQKLSALDGALTKKERGAKALALGYVLQIFYMIANGGEKRRESTRLPDSIAALQSYIDMHFAELSTVNELAHHFFYSREYVSRLFKKYFNTTVTDYIRVRRVAAAQTLISKGEPITSVCCRVGFSSHAAFIRAFKKETGMTPSEYKAGL